MPRLIFLVLAFACGGCPWSTATSDTAHGIEARGLTTSAGNIGGAVHATIGASGVYVAAELDERLLRREGDPQAYAGTSFDASLRLSVLGVLPTQHQLERYLDLGVELGGGGGLASDGSLLAEGFAGAWVELGTIEVSDHGYVVLTAGIRAVDLGDRFADDTLYTVGLGWRARQRTGPFRLY